MADVSFEELLIRMCQVLGIPELTSEDIRKIREDSKAIPVGKGGYGSCCRYIGNYGDLVIKTFFGKYPFGDIFKETLWLHAVQGISGVQELVGVNTKDLLLVTKYAGESLLSYIIKNPLTYDDLREIMI